MKNKFPDIIFYPPVANHFPASVVGVAVACCFSVDSFVDFAGPYFFAAVDFVSADSVFVAEACFVVVDFVAPPASVDFVPARASPEDSAVDLMKLPAFSFSSSSSF